MSLLRDFIGVLFQMNLQITQPALGLEDLEVSEIRREKKLLPFFQRVVAKFRRNFDGGLKLGNLVCISQTPQFLFLREEKFSPLQMKRGAVDFT